MEQYSALPEQKAAISTWMEPSNENAMPPVSPTQDESKKFATVMNDVKTRFEEAFARRFAVKERAPIRETERVLYLMEAKD